MQDYRKEYGIGRDKVNYYAYRILADTGASGPVPGAGVSGLGDEGSGSL